MRSLALLALLAGRASAAPAAAPSAALVPARSAMTRVPGLPSPELIGGWARGVSAAYGWQLTWNGMDAKERVARETAGVPMGVPRETLPEAARDAYDNSSHALWAASFAFGDQARLAGTLLPIARAGQTDPARAAALIDKLERIKTLPQDEALGALRELESLRLAAGPEVVRNLQRVLDAKVRREGEPLDDKAALKKRISEVNYAVQALMGLEFYPGVPVLAEEAAAKLGELQTAWVERFGDELPAQGFVMATEGAVFATGKGTTVGKRRDDRSRLKPASRARNKPAWRKRLKRRR